MLSPAAQHRIKASVAGKALLTAPVMPSKSNSKSALTLESKHESVFMAQFKAEFYQMGHIKSRARRKDVKRQVLGRHQEWLDSVMQRQQWQGDETNMFVWLTLWTLDIGEWKRGLDLARFALISGMTSPKEFNRSLAETVCEEIVGGILKAGDCHPYLNLLEDLAALLKGHDMADQITAKLYKARGLAWMTLEPSKARDMLLKALAFDVEVGVKRHLNTLNGHSRQSSSPLAAIQDYSLSGRAAAKLANMTAPAFLRHAKKHPDQLPHLAIPVGQRIIYRFNPKHVKAYLKQYFINSKV